MELGTGNYKQTEYGPIPNDWIIAEFQDVIDGFSSGQTPSRAKPEFYNGKIPWITSGELNYNVITDTKEKITKEGVQDALLKTIPVGTFLFAITGLEAAGTRGSCAITGIEATTNQSCMALYPKNGILTTPYIYHFYVGFGNEIALKYCQGTKQQSFTAAIAKKLPIILPPTIEEQKAIAQVLSDFDKLIDGLERLIAKKSRIKEGVMQELLRPKESWDLKELGDVCQVVKGQLITNSSRLDGSVPVIAGGKTPAYFHNKPNRLGRTITISASGASAGYVGFYETPIFASDCSTISEGGKFNIEFIYFWLVSIQGLIYSLQTGGAQPHIHPKDLRPIQIAIPQLKVQNEVAAVLSDLHKEINSIQSKLEKLKFMKSGIMHQLLTGKTRLV